MSKAKQKQAPKKGWKPKRGALWVVAALLLASGVIRIATGTGPALAREVEALMDSTADHAEEMEHAPAECEPAGDIGKVLAALGLRETEMDRREAALADRLAALSLAEQEIEKNLTALEQAEEQLSQTLALADGAAEQDLVRLTAVYEAMKPKDAAELFEQMAPQFAAGFLGRMRPDHAAEVMAGLEAQTAYSISVFLAGRNAGVPTE